MLDKNDGIVKISNFLPSWVAEGILQVLQTKNSTDFEESESN